MSRRGFDYTLDFEAIDLDNPHDRGATDTQETTNCGFLAGASDLQVHAVLFALGRWHLPPRIIDGQHHDIATRGPGWQRRDFPMDPLSLTILALGGVFLLVGALSLARRRPRSPHALASTATGAVHVPTERQEWIFAQVWPKAHATSEDLQALGRALEAWWAEHPLVTQIEGLDYLLSGRYPPSDGPTPCEEETLEEPVLPRHGGGVIEYGFRRLTIIDPWKYCPAIVWGGEGMEGKDARGCLERSLPPELVSRIGLDIGGW
jgi:hypothetical protein